jgi:CHAD domain-containing protein
MASARCVQFVLNQKTDIEHIFELLCQQYASHEANHIRIQRQYLDSFDWRLYHLGYVCGMDSCGSEHRFFICHKETDNSIYEFPLDKVARFSRDIPHRSCRQLLDSVLDIRALITAATIHIKRKQLLVLDKEGKTLAILHAESYSTAGQAEDNSIPARLMVLPVRGYKKAFKQVVQYSSQHLKLPYADSTLFDAVLAATGQTPAAPAIVQKLTESLNTREALQILLTHLLSVIQANEQGIRAAIDTEFLHDYRVAVRRARSILGQIKQVFPDKVLAYFRQELSWLGTMTGPTRDLDMYLLKFDSYTQELPPGLQNDLIPFRQFLQHHWQVEHKQLCQALDSKRYHKLISEWQRVLTNKPDRSQAALNAIEPAKQVANQRIWKLYKRVLREGAAISEQSHDEELHELRKTCKKFRYLLEFFHDYYADEQIKKLIKTLKLLQENLGDFQDLSIQITQLIRFAQEMQDEGLAETKTIIAMGVLVEKLTARKEAVRAHFGECFKEFTSPSKRAEFTNALSPHHQPGGMSV